MRNCYAKLGKLVAIGIGAGTAFAGGALTAHCYENFNMYQYKGSNSLWDFNWDKREPVSLVKRSRTESRKDPPKRGTAEEIEKLTATAKRQVVLIRHGQYNLEGETDPQNYLTELGKEQAASAGKRIKDLGISIDAMVCSDMQRAVETADIIAAELNLGRTEDTVGFTKDPMLREGIPAAPEPPMRTSAWGITTSDIFIDGVRIEAAFRKYIHRAAPTQREDSCDVLVCHGNVIRYFICRALQFPPDAWLRIQVNNASITTLTIHPDGEVTVESVGDSGHLTADSVTTM